MFNCPESFKLKVKKLFPGKKMHKLLEVGCCTVGYYLKNRYRKGISPGKILRATSLERLKENVREIKDLHKEWEELCNKQEAGFCVFILSKILVEAYVISLYITVFNIFFSNFNATPEMF